MSPRDTCFSLNTRTMIALDIPCRPQLEPDAIPTLFGKHVKSFGQTASELLVQKPREAFRKREVDRIVREYDATPTCSTNGPPQQNMSSTSTLISESSDNEGVDACTTIDLPACATDGEQYTSSVSAKLEQPKQRSRSVQVCVAEKKIKTVSRKQPSKK